MAEPIRFDEARVQVLCLENPKLYRDIYSSFAYDATEENKIIFSENFVPLKTKGNICTIENVLRLTYPGSVMKKMYEQIENYCYSELPEKTFQLRSHLVDFAQTVVRDFDFDFDFSYDIKLTEVFKLLCLKPAEDNLNLLNELVDYIRVIHKYLPQKCFVVFNLHLFFSADELESFYNDILNNHIQLLVIENKMTFEKNQFENLIILDNDFCEIVEK